MTFLIEMQHSKPPNLRNLLLRNQFLCCGLLRTLRTLRCRGLLTDCCLLT
jgi:hypothetical protein